MITKTDCLNLLIELKEQGLNVDNEIKQLLISTEPSIDIIKTINDNMELSVRTFYEKLRKSYNDKHSKLYINIVNHTKLQPREVLCTLGSLQLQILLFNKDINDTAFLRNARFDEISKVLLNYYNTKDIIPCQKLIDLFKADLKLLEEISK